jgi:hypothetical protein
VKTATDAFTVLESWTDDYATASRFDGFSVLEIDIPVERIFLSYRGPNWINGRFGLQNEYIVLPPGFKP